MDNRKNPQTNANYAVDKYKKYSHKDINQRHYEFKQEKDECIDSTV